MKITGHKKLARQLRSMPDASRKHVTQMLAKSGQEAVRVAKVLVPEDTGDLESSIRYETHDQGMTVEVIAGHDDRESQIQARTVEGGRSPGSSTGGMAAQPFMNPTKKYLAKRHRARVKRAINKAAKEAVSRG